MRNFNTMGFLLCSMFVIGGAACSSTSSGNPPPDPDAGSGHSDRPALPAGPEAGAADASDGAPAKALANAKITLKIPTDFAGTPRQLNVVLVDTVPPKGPPSAILVQKNMPAVVAGQSLALTADVSLVPKGDYFVVAVIYMEGGGQFSPKSGVDYVANTTGKVTFDGTSVDLGALEVAQAR